MSFFGRLYINVKLDVRGPIKVADIIVLVDL